MSTVFYLDDASQGFDVTDRAHADPEPDTNQLVDSLEMIIDNSNDSKFDKNNTIASTQRADELGSMTMGPSLTDCVPLLRF